MPANSLEQVRNLCMRRGFVFPGSAVYGGVASFWDYGPLGVELLNNIKKAWWQDTIYTRNDMEGLDAAVLMSRKVWQHSGHEATFGDVLIENRKNNRRHRLDHLLLDQDPKLLGELLERSAPTWDPSDPQIDNLAQFCGSWLRHHDGQDSKVGFSYGLESIQRIAQLIKKGNSPVTAANFVFLLTNLAV